MTYVPNGGPCLRCLLGSVPPHEQNVLCTEAGVLGAVTGVLGSIQAAEAIKYLLGIGELLVGKILNFDALSMNIRVTKMSKAYPHCRVCGENPDILSLAENREEYELQGCCACNGDNK